MPSAARSAHRPLGGLDRTLGLVFGLARGAALVILAYIIAGMVVPVDRWPPPVLASRACWHRPIRGALWAVRAVAGRLPAATLTRRQPDGHATRGSLAARTPQGSALSRPAGPAVQE